MDLADLFQSKKEDIPNIDFGDLGRQGIKKIPKPFFEILVEDTFEKWSDQMVDKLWKMYGF